MKETSAISTEPKSQPISIRSIWDKTKRYWRIVVDVFALLGLISALTAFIPFISAYVGRPQIVVRLPEDESGKAFICGEKGDLLLMVGTDNEKHEVTVQEVKIEFNSEHLELELNDIFTRVGLRDADKTWLLWNGEQKLQPKSFSLFSAPFLVRPGLTNSTLLTITVKAFVPSSELGSPWSIFPSPVEKMVFPVTLNWQRNDSGKRFGLLLNGKESVQMWGGAGTNAIYWRPLGGSTQLRILKVPKSPKSSARSE